jgi:light-regulated signal transduction histidine kinase (bacteriophytochrome)
LWWARQIRSFPDPVAPKIKSTVSFGSPQNAMAKSNATRLLQLALVIGTAVICVTGFVGIVFGQPLLGVIYAGMGAVVALLTQRVAERKREQEELRRVNEILEQRVLARTAELDATNQELEAFSYSVAHDLRAPLRHMDGFIRLLKKHASSALDERNQRYLGIISDSARQMGVLIDDLLNFSRVGRTELQLRAISLHQLVEEAMQELSEETQGRNIAWKIGPLPDVTVDRSMLRLVMVNLLANAVKFTSKREQAEIEVGAFSNEADEIVVFVRDNGVGFDMEYAGKLFGVFQRLHPAEEYEGTGIGLANVQRIIHRHKGRTWAKGEVDRGATFYFCLPKATEATTHAKVQAHAAG